MYFLWFCVFSLGQMLSDCSRAWAWSKGHGSGPHALEHGPGPWPTLCYHINANGPAASNSPEWIAHGHGYGPGHWPRRLARMDIICLGMILQASTKITTTAVTTTYRPTQTSRISDRSETYNFLHQSLIAWALFLRFPQILQNFGKLGRLLTVDQSACSHAPSSPPRGPTSKPPRTSDNFGSLRNLHFPSSIPYYVGTFAAISANFQNFGNPGRLLVVDQSLCNHVHSSPPRGPIYKPP